MHFSQFELQLIHVLVVITEVSLIGQDATQFPVMTSLKYPKLHLSQDAEFWQDSQFTGQLSQVLFAKFGNDEIGQLVEHNLVDGSLT